MSSGAATMRFLGGAAAGPLLVGPLLVGVVLAGLASGPAWAAPAPVVLAAHHASYDLALSSTHGGGTVSATGTMSFAIGDACDAWSSRQVLHLQMVTREGRSSDLVSSYATLESKDGRHLRFDMQERDDGTLASQVRGDAELFPDGTGAVHYVLPSRSTVKLPRGTLFPMAHTAAIIRAAEAGEKAVAIPLFDGTGPDGAADSYVTVLDWHGPPSDSPYKPLAALASGRVHVAFFSRKPGTITPDYESGMRYFANGVSDRLSMDFGDFTMEGTMRSFAPDAPAKC